MEDSKTLPGMDGGAPQPKAPSEAGHEEWVKQTIEKRMKKKAEGKAVYHDFGEVAAEFDHKAT